MILKEARCEVHAMFDQLKQNFTMSKARVIFKLQSQILKGAHTLKKQQEFLKCTVERQD